MKHRYTFWDWNGRPAIIDDNGWGRAWTVLDGRWSSADRGNVFVNGRSLSGEAFTKKFGPLPQFPRSQRLERLVVGLFTLWCLGLVVVLTDRAGTLLTLAVVATVFVGKWIESKGFALSFRGDEH